MFDFENLSISCEGNGVQCPDTTKNSTTFYSVFLSNYNAVSQKGKLTAQANTSLDAIYRGIFATVPNFPKDASIKFTITFTPKRVYHDRPNALC